MDNLDCEIIIESEGVKYELVYNTQFLLLNEKDKIHLTLPKSVKNWKVTFEFTDDDSVAKLNLNWEIKDGIISFKLNKWYSSTWIENKTPAHFSTKDKASEYQFKIRTQANTDHPYRMFYLTVWKKIQ